MTLYDELNYAAYIHYNDELILDVGSVCIIDILLLVANRNTERKSSSSYSSRRKSHTRILLVAAPPLQTRITLRIKAGGPVFKLIEKGGTSLSSSVSS